MRTILALAALAVVAGVGVTGVALAGTDGRDAQQRGVSATALKGEIEKMGYDVRRLKSDDGHYKAVIVERESGGAVKAIFAKDTGELIGAKLASDDREHEGYRERDEHREKRHEARERKETRDRDDRPMKQERIEKKDMPAPEKRG